jgi:hypothetical protein
MGGFAFYFGVVVPTGSAVIGGSEQGYVTQQVSYWLNVIGLIALAVLLCTTIPTKSRLLWGTWGLMAMCQVALLILHAQLDRLIVAPERQILNQERFHHWHELYEGVATSLWVVGMAHLGILVHLATNRAAETECSREAATADTESSL